MQAGMQASLRSLRLRESDRAPANAGARLRLRAEVRRSRVAQAGLVVSVGIGTTRLRRPQSVTPPRDGLRPRSGTVPPATAYRHRPGLCPPATAFRPRSGDHGLCPGAALRRCAPTLGARDAKNRRFWSLAVKTDGFSRSRKRETDVFVGCSRMGFPVAQIIVRFGLEAAKNRLF